MQKIVCLPQVELNLENAMVVKLTAQAGDFVNEGQTIIEIETQKATVEVPCDTSGYLRDYLVQVDDEVCLSDPLAVLTDEPDEPFEAPISGEKTTVATSANRGEVVTEAGAKAHREALSSGKVRAAPAARKRARELGIELSEIEGTGPGGRITVHDVDDHNAKRELTTIQSTENGAWLPLRVERKALIEQMQRGHTEIPQICMARRIDVNPISEGEEGSTFTSRLVHRIARALREHPDLRTTIDIGGQRVRVNPVNIAIAMDTPHGLLAPVIRGADVLTIEEISIRIHEFRKRGSRNLLRKDDLRDGPFAVSNLGMFGVDLFSPIVFYGQTAVLAIGRVKEKKDGSKTAWFNLAVDHRVVDGAGAARFLQTLQQVINGEKTD